MPRKDEEEEEAPESGEATAKGGSKKVQPGEVSQLKGKARFSLPAAIRVASVREAVPAEILVEISCNDAVRFSSFLVTLPYDYPWVLPARNECW